MVNTNLLEIQNDIRTAAKKAGRRPEEIRLICVTKEAKSAQILDALSNGAKELGENRVKEAVLKHRAIGVNAIWHLIGHLQTNKVKDSLSMFELIHSVDSIKLARCIDKEAKRIGKIQKILIEVNVSGEQTKFGISPEDLGEVLESLKDLKNIEINGLMTVTPLTDQAEDSRPYFRVLRELRDKYKLKELSMGMTQDYGVAIEEGATMVRIGSAIFKK